MWIDLERLYGPPREHVASAPAGSLRDRMRRTLRLTGTVPGMLRWWVRSSDGRWLGLCDFTLCDVGGTCVVRQEGVAVPAEALAPIPPEPRS